MKHMTCESCRWWMGKTEVKGIVLDWLPGECRRRAPQGSGCASWPMTDPDDFCAEHELSPSAEAMGLIEDDGA